MTGIAREVTVKLAGYGPLKTFTGWAGSSLAEILGESYSAGTVYQSHNGGTVHGDTIINEDMTVFAGNKAKNA